MNRTKDGFWVNEGRTIAPEMKKSNALRRTTWMSVLRETAMIEEIGAGFIIGQSASMKKVYCLIDRVAQADAPVLLLGETGTGKSMLARLIHLRSKRSKHNFLTINCGTIPETLLESELFGHKKGAFTGAFTDKKGLLEEAQTGTIFLDEIANTSPSFQAKILEAIEEKIVRPIGETTTRKIDVRFLFATSKDLESEVASGRFRLDLFYRINVISLEIPPLRKRKKDIPMFARFFLKRYSQEMNKMIKGFTPDAMKRLKSYHWPGNVRELQNIIDRAAVLTHNHRITQHDLGFETRIARKIIPLKELRKRAIIEALTTNNWNISKTATQLGIGRVTLWRHIKEHRIQK